MNEYRQIPIQMTSNNTPEPFLIDNATNTGYGDKDITQLYKMFDNDENTNYHIYYNNNLTFNITLNKKIKLNKINIINNGDCYISSFSLYGINDDNTETLITTQNRNQYNHSLPFNFTFDNNKFYKKYKMSIVASRFGMDIYIKEIQLFTKNSFLIKSSDNQFFGLDSTNNFISFYDISLYQNYSIDLNKILENVNKIPDLSSYRILKFK